MYSLLLLIGLMACQRTQQTDNAATSAINQDHKLWSKEKALQWYSEQEWIIGANFTPSTAINQIEFCQEDTFNPETIDLELRYARDCATTHNHWTVEWG